MTVLVLTNCPAGLRGLLTRWLLEISPGVFIGSPSARVRDILWEEVRTYSGQGRAILTHTTDNEQGFTFRTHDHAWHPTDHEGITLLHRPTQPDPHTKLTGAPGAEGQAPKQGWSKAAKRRRFGA
ncbi:type I-E CRISPR-associated endoribonuclease Cas2e [Streptomyces zhihengii]|uniref:Type I-E CRISPR-associated endoribonuclease Cas2 n=1 Tax=Streptomyces zhihengii TaxID=1818004 RepID=A0ABS2V4I6_9ACTN|nr:type I-E CRISPR-associated endoribonuclease Cas2e [Streptomyces zhihengii]MBM9624670.1 type I-E CRISPR-associated endoribonuclease Cas2 [Streptomyces zhihengii]